MIALGAYIAQAAIPPPTNPGTAFEVVIDTSKAYTGTATYTRQIESGDLVSVQAHGALRLGPFTDSVDPEGTERDSLGFPLGDAYKVVSNFPDGALLCKISSEHEWRKCGVGLIFRAKSRGNLEFLVNDAGLHVHNGLFGINVMVQH